MEQVRSFIAIELPNELKLGLNQLEAQLKSGKQPGVKWVNPYSIHLTLKFLGNIAVDRTNEVTKAMSEAVQGISPFHLEVKELGVFPNLRRVQTLARLRNQASLDERQRLGELIAGTRFEVAYTIKVDTISLIRSQLTREGAIYSRISAVGLNKPLSTASA